MAKSKGSYVNTAGEVVLSKARETDISNLSSKSARTELRKMYEAQVMKKHEARQEYLATRNEYSSEVLDSGRLRVKGTGGRWAHFTKSGIQALIADLANVKKLIAKMPDDPTAKDEDEESEEDAE